MNTERGQIVRVPKRLPLDMRTKVVVSTSLLRETRRKENSASRQTALSEGHFKTLLSTFFAHSIHFKLLKAD